MGSIPLSPKNPPGKMLCPVNKCNVPFVVLQKTGNTQHPGDHYFDATIVFLRRIDFSLGLLTFFLKKKKKSLAKSILHTG